MISSVYIVTVETVEDDKSGGRAVGVTDIRAILAKASATTLLERGTKTKEIELKSSLSREIVWCRKRQLRFSDIWGQS